MQSAIEADLKQLKLAFTLYERADKAISTKSIHKELSARLSEELDYNSCLLYTSPSPRA